jgi:uncharacterized membrane protein YidH (DUF202 family)
MNIDILPLAFTMMVGPQIMSAIIFVTTDRPVRTSLAFIGGVLAAAAAGVAITFALGSLLGNSVDLGDPSDPSSTGHVIQYVLVALLILAALKNYRNREQAEPPKWLGSLMTATPLKALSIGLLVILLMPSDIVVMLTVGTNLAHNGSAYVDALPFIGLTGVIAAFPLLFFLVFHRRAVLAMPKVRDWVNSHSWLVNIIACLIFVVLILT